MRASKPPPIGSKIRAARLDRRVMQKDLSRQLRLRGIGIFPANLCRIEQGKEDPSWTTIAAIADLLDLEAAELVSYDENERQKNG